MRKLNLTPINLVVCHKAAADCSMTATSFTVKHQTYGRHATRGEMRWMGFGLDATRALHMDAEEDVAHPHAAVAIDNDLIELVACTWSRTAALWGLSAFFKLWA